MLQYLREHLNGVRKPRVQLLLPRSLLCSAEFALANLPVLAGLRVEPVTGDGIL